MHPSETLAVALGEMGLGECAARVYGHLVELAPLTRDELIAEVGGGAVTSAGVDELVEVGLVGVVGVGGTQLAPVAPVLGLDLLSRRRASVIDTARMDVLAAYDTFRRRRPASDESGVEAVTGDTIGLRLQQAWRAAESTIEQFDSPPYVDITGSLEDAFDTLDRGVSQRVVYAQASFTDETYFREIVEPAVRRGEEARVIDEVPLKMILIDRRLAMVSATLEGAERHHTTYVVTNDVVLQGLIALFNATWEAALPLGAQLRSGNRRLEGVDRNLLTMLASGLHDGEIARQVGVSRRTLSRRLEILMARAGATSRFQLALQAHRRGWV